MPPLYSNRQQPHHRIPTTYVRVPVRKMTSSVL